MNDLYRRIGLPAETDDRAVIERAIAVTAGSDARSARAARHVLLDRDRKSVYDRTRAAVMQVGKLRANLGLSRAPNWLVSDCSDFDTTPSSTVSQLQALRAPRRQPPASNQNLSVGGGIGLFIGAVVLCSCIIWGLLDIGSSRGRSTGSLPSRSQSTYVPPATSTANNRPLPPVETRAEKVRKLVTKRLERAGLVSDATTVDNAVQKLIQGQADLVPATGVLTRNFYGQGVAPLEIKTRAGSNYYVKVVDWSTKAEIMTAFVRGGSPFETTVPVGSYEIKYAAGQSWYGPILDFGDGGSYARCDDRFDFSLTSDGYNGYTIELILQKHGNLQTDPISADDF
jgi:hypothetical protein